MSVVKKILDRAFHESPEQNLHYLKNRIVNRNKGDIYDAESVLNSKKHMRTQRCYDFLSRYETILSRGKKWEPIGFQDKTILELGCGPVLGFAPLAVYLGAKEYLCLDPAFNPAVIKDTRFTERYLLKVYKDLQSLYTERMSFKEYQQAMVDRVTIHVGQVEELESERQFDAMFSNSCWEHIRDLGSVIAKLVALSAPNCRHLHIVDYGSHQVGANPFEQIYYFSPEQYRATYGHHLNLLRPSDVAAILKSKGLALDETLYYAFAEFLDMDRVHAHWTREYGVDELTQKVVIYSH